MTCDMAPLPKTAIYIAMTDAQAIALGRVIAQWAYCEHLMDRVLKLLLSHQSASRFRKDLNISFKKRTELWKSLVASIHGTEKKEKEEVEQLIQRLKAAHDTRDKLVHGIRWALSDRINFHRHQTCGGISTEEVSISPNAMEELRKEIGELSWDVNLYWNEVLIFLASAHKQK